jgi:hypothetical protein
MKKEVSPVIIVIAVVAALAVVVGFGYKAARPAPYKMSPGGGPRAVNTTGAPMASSGGVATPSGGMVSPNASGQGRANPAFGGGGMSPQGAPVSTSGGMGMGNSPTSGGFPPPGAPR